MAHTQSSDLVPRTVLVAGHAFVVGVVVWLLIAGGWRALGVEPAVNSQRAILVAVCAASYWLRLLLTSFVFLRRRLPWAEVRIVLAWMSLLHLSFAYGAARSSAPPDWVAVLGLLLYAAGSFVNTASEYGRHRWKRSHPGELYTQGMFRYSRHVNYF